MSVLSRLNRVAALLLLVLLAPVAEAGQARFDPTRASDLLVEAWMRQDLDLDVIVHLESHDPALKSGAAPEDRLAAVHEMLSVFTTDLMLKHSTADLHISRPFRLQPAFAATVSRHGLASLMLDPEVKFVELDRKWPVSTLEGLPIINADVLQYYGITGDDTAVAVIDTGIDYLHPALGQGEIPNAKVVHGLDTGDLDDDPLDCSGHGTAVASVAAGAPYQWSPNRRFAGGVAPEAHILAYKASPDAACGTLVESAVVAAIEDAILHRSGSGYSLAAINISAGAGFYDGACDPAISAYGTAVDLALSEGIAVVASSGNEGKSDTLNAPACLRNTISVGSVWDSDSGDVGYSFCLDPDCQDWCDDSFSPALNVTCYTNSSPSLDFLAPSEYLRAAEAGGQTLEFGGTSGAAAYVTGGIALLRDAFPDLQPVQARLLLELTGTAIYDQRNGISRPIIDLEQALDLRGLALSEEANSAIPLTAGSRLQSTVYVDEDGSVGHMRVLIKLSHPQPENLVISLSSPDGTEVVLHDRGPGTTDRADEVSRFNGLVVTYPDSRSPTQSLDGFASLQLRGTWTLEIFAAETTSAAATPVLIGWGLDFEAKIPPDPQPGTSFFLPIATRSPGANDTFWTSDIRILNPLSTISASVWMYLVAAGDDGSADFEQREVTISPGAVLNLPDFLARSFAADEFHGQLIFQCEVPGPVATSRIFNSGTVAGTYGQYVETVDGDHGTARDETPLYMIHLANSEEFRANIGFSEIAGESATINLILRNADTGEQTGMVGIYDLLPFTNLQINRVFESLGAGSSHNAYATVEVVTGEGRVTSYASVVDNLTGDAIFIPGVPPQESAEWMVPVVARSLGAADTNWVSDLRVYNHGSVDLGLDLEFRPRHGGGGESGTVAVSVVPGCVLALDNVVGETFGFANSSGSLRLVLHSDTVTATATAIVTSRTYNRTDAGSYGQFIPAVSTGLRNDGAVIHLDKNSDYRTNLGLCEVGGSSLNLLLTLRNSEGVMQGSSRVVNLAPYELSQINDIYGFTGAPAQENSWVQITRISGDGSYAAYGSVVDEYTGDAIYVPAQAISQ